MGKKKITMELITKRSNRASTFRQRKASLFKKAHELATLCGVEVGLVVAASPDDSAPEVWPSLEEVANMASRANDRTTNGKHTKTMARQVADMKVELNRLEMENLALEAEYFLEEAISGRSQVAEVASPELAMRLRVMIESRKKAVDDRINSVLSQQVAFHSAAPHVPGLSDEPDETQGLFNDLTTDIANTSELCGAEWIQIDGRPPLPCWPAEIDVGAEIDASLPVQVPFSSAAPDMGQPGLPVLPSETGEFVSCFPAETAYSSEMHGADWMRIDDGPPIMCWPMEDVMGEYQTNDIPPEQAPFSSATPYIGLPGLSDLPIETGEFFRGLPVEIARSSELRGADRLQVVDGAPPMYCPVYDDDWEEINAILSSFKG